MSLFIGGLAFTSGNLQNQVKLGVFSGSAWPLLRGFSSCGEPKPLYSHENGQSNAQAELRLRHGVSRVVRERPRASAPRAPRGRFLSTIAAMISP